MTVEQDILQAEAIVKGLRWLAQGGRDKARILQSVLESNGEGTDFLDECVLWFDDIAAGVDI